MIKRINRILTGMLMLVIVGIGIVPYAYAISTTPPVPTNLQNTSGNYWVNYTWSAGSGGAVIDLFNVSVNGTWDNTSSNSYKNVSISPGSWVNITVWAYNTTGNGNLSATNVSDQVQVLSSTLSCTCGDICVNTSGWWRDDSSINYNSTPIQAAVDNAITGNTICVYTGSYIENVNISKKLTLKGRSASGVIVTASDKSQSVFNVTADSVNITGFAARGESGSNSLAGILLNNTESCNISGNILNYNDYGIYLKSSSNNNTITNNIVNSNQYGIYLNASNNNTLRSNTANSNTDSGIKQTDSTGNEIKDNTLSGNNRDIHVTNTVSTFTDNTLKGSKISFTYSGNVSLKGVSSPASTPSGYSNINKFITVINASAGAWVFLNFTYSDSDVTDLDETRLKVYKYNGSWYADGWFSGNQYSDNTNNIAGANITSFSASTFVPLAPKYGSIKGTITDSNTNLPVSSASVSVIYDGVTVQTVTSGLDGTYAISSIANHTYSLNVTAANYCWNNDTTVTVLPGTMNSSRDVALTPDKVTLTIKSGESNNKIAVKGNETIFNLTVTNYNGTDIKFVVDNSSTNATVKINGSSAPVNFFLNHGISKEFNATIINDTAGYYPVTITVTNASKSAGLTLYATIRNESGYTNQNSDITGGGTASDGAVLVNSTVSSDASVNSSTIQNTTVSGSNTIVNDSSIVIHGNITKNAVITGSSIILHSNVTGDSSVVSSESTVDNSNVNNSTVSNSKIVNVTITGSTVKGVTIDTGYNMALTNATVTDGISNDKPVIKGKEGAEIITCGINFSNIYIDVPIEDLIKSQTGNIATIIDTPTLINEANKVGCDLNVTTDTVTSINISKTGINPDGGDTNKVKHSKELSNFLHIQCSNETAVQNAVVRIYCDSSVDNYESVNIYYYNKSSGTWDKLTTTSGDASGRTYYETQELDHLSTFTLLGVTAAPTPTTPSSSGGGGGIKLILTPTVTATATPKETAALETETPVITGIEEEKKDLLGFIIFFAIVGIIAVTYIIMRKKR